MVVSEIPCCAYRPGTYSAYAFVHGGDGWSHHQGPSLYRFADGRVLVIWGAYDIQECSNDGLSLYSTSDDEGSSWRTPLVWMCTPNAVVSHFQIAETGLFGEAIMVYREGHFAGAVEDKRRRISTTWASYGRSTMHILTRRSADGGATWGAPSELDPVLVVGRTAPPFYGGPEQMLRLSDGSLLLLVVYLDPERRDPQHFNCAVLRSTDRGASWVKTGDVTVNEQRGAMEPSVVEVGGGRLTGVIRNKSGYLYRFDAADFGCTVLPPRRTALPSVESMSRVLRLASGKLLLVWNNQSSTAQEPRHPLAAALSPDLGESWGAPKIIADELERNQLSNFSLLQAADGRILVCTSHYRALEPSSSDLDMLVLDERWLSA